MKGYLLQAIGIPLWWVGMACSESFYRIFAFPGMSRASLFAFLAPDLAIISALSLYVFLRPSRLLQGCILGAFGYGALWCLSSSVLTGGGYLSAVVMAVGTLFNVMLVLGQKIFRMSACEDSGRNMVHTCIQSAVLWTVTLIVFPLVIVHAIGTWPPPYSPLPASLGGGLFIACSALGLWSGMVMAKRGGGTPLPTRCPRRLVVAGPYAYVRNPMAIAGLGQGMGVAIVLGSSAVAGYVLIGLVVWNYVVRPEEETYLLESFGEPFSNYRNAVRCWIPRWTKYAPQDAIQSME